MNINQLRTFVEVAEQESFTKAANRLHLSQSAVSWQIKSLENDLGIKLLDWHDKRIRFSEAGRLLLSYARQIVALGNEIALTVEQLKELRKGHVKLGAGTIVAGECVLPFFLGAFHRMHPGLEVHLETGKTERILQWVKGGVADLGVVDTTPAINGINFPVFMDDEIMLILPPDHPLAVYDSVPPEELSYHPMVMREKGSSARSAIDKLLRPHGILLDELLIIHEFRSNVGIIHAVEAGLGISLSSRWAAQEAIMNRRLISRPLQGINLKRTLYLALPQKTGIDPAVQAFSEFLLDPEVQSDIVRRFFPRTGMEKPEA